MTLYDVKLEWDAGADGRVALDPVLAAQDLVHRAVHVGNQHLKRGVAAVVEVGNANAALSKEQSNRRGELHVFDAIIFRWS